MSKILHLSDIHFGRNYSEYNEDGVFDRKELILDVFQKWIKNQNI